MTEDVLLLMERKMSRKQAQTHTKPNNTKLKKNRQEKTKT